MEKIRVGYRVRKDIHDELKALVKLVNYDRPKDISEITETFVVESALVDYMKKVKAALCARNSFKAKCCEMGMLPKEECEHGV